MNHSQVADKYQVHSTMIQTHYFSYSIDDVIVNMLSSSVVDRGFEPLSGQAKDYKIGICCFYAKHTLLRSKSKDMLAWNEDNVSQWSNMSICGLFCYFSKLALQKSN